MESHSIDFKAKKVQELLSLFDEIKDIKCKLDQRDGEKP